MGTWSITTYDDEAGGVIETTLKQGEDKVVFTLSTEEALDLGTNLIRFTGALEQRINDWENGE